MIWLATDATFLTAPKRKRHATREETERYALPATERLALESAPGIRTGPVEAWGWLAVIVEICIKERVPVAREPLPYRGRVRIWSQPGDPAA